MRFFEKSNASHDDFAAGFDLVEDELVLVVGVKRVFDVHLLAVAVLV